MGVVAVKLVDSFELVLCLWRPLLVLLLLEELSISGNDLGVGMAEAILRENVSVCLSDDAAQAFVQAERSPYEPGVELVAKSSKLEYSRCGSWVIRINEVGTVASNANMVFDETLAGLGILDMSSVETMSLTLCG